MLRPGERNRLEEGINYFPAGAPRRTLFSTLMSLDEGVEAAQCRRRTVEAAPVQRPHLPATKSE